MHEMKVFGIGLGRTGTLSLTRAMEQLGFATKHCPRFYLGQQGEVRIDWDDFETNDAVTDEGVALVYREADRRYPGSRFILTARDLESWLRSRKDLSKAMRDHWGRDPAVAVLHTTLYGSATFDRDLYAEAYRQHLASVQDYFTDRPQDLLTMDICAGDGWEKLCPFLDMPIPDDPFPRTNVFAESDWATTARQEDIQPPGGGDTGKPRG